MSVFEHKLNICISHRIWSRHDRTLN